MIKNSLMMLLVWPFFAHAQQPQESTDWQASIFAQFGYFQQSTEQQSWQIPGFITGGESQPHDSGVQLFHGELALWGNIEEVLSGNIIIGSHGLESPEIEELWLQPWLGQQWQIRFGRQLANIGLYNAIHDHEWRFIDATLSQTVFLGGQYTDDAVSVNYNMGDLELFTWIGRGANFPSSVNPDSAKPNAYGLGWQWLWLGTESSFLLNNSLSQFNATERDNSNSDHHNADQVNLSLSGETTLLTLGAEWQYLQGGWQVESMIADVEGGVVDSLQLQADISARYYGISSEWYWQWNVVETAIRYDWLNSHNKLSINSNDFAQVLNSRGHNPSRLSAVVNWSFAKYQMLRLQANFEQLSEESETAFWMVYQGKLSW
ncbi:hypothetical protein CW745_13780 [Psychromonas sp. psych-6C06]|uniref:hypothetical protein n=1 Tax=Psychromonas sp. psych-6C06 TaxID=2058089 RepID=UPI000C322D0F|nr:hypothetical protein [Psychromonas sp. psych-6C06]PKF60597.1 hypothetical protein CW745_13780 [Psychromonas sp. psych-6C06]